MIMFRCTPGLLSVAVSLLVISTASAEEWTIPLAGNTFRIAPAPGGRDFGRNGVLNWSAADDVYAVYFHVNQPCTLALTLKGRGADGRAQLICRQGDQQFQVTWGPGPEQEHPVGQINIKAAGYVRVDIQGHSREGASFGGLKELVIRSDDAGLQLDYVKTNDGNMFYWGRRGPSVHLRYEVPREKQIRYAYSELTVPVGSDPLGSYFMANGFAEGYFGIQVNSDTERRVLFSVWSPFNTDNPREIPEEQRIIPLARGPEVRIGEFGNEGSGGQSFLVYPWQAGKTYRFLTEVRPDGQGNTIYTSWFGDKAADEWRLIASFRRPQTNTHYKGFHSFLENFNPATGHQSRTVQYSNIWVRDIMGRWTECTAARFSVDATGNGRHRLDFTGGATGKSFYLQNCGFLNETGQPGARFVRESSGVNPPEIDFKSLPLH